MMNNQLQHGSFQRKYLFAIFLCFCCCFCLLCGCSGNNKPLSANSSGEQNKAALPPLPLLRPPVSHAKNPALNEMLQYYGRRYNRNVQMVRFSFNNPGYHSKIPTGTRVHRTRESLAYALGLLQRTRTHDVQRATDILNRIAKLQDQQPGSKTRGLWSWLLEEPLDQMDTPDFNWADFCGASIAHVLVMHKEMLPEVLVAKLKRCLQEAAFAIKKRDVQAGYTNIAILGGGVCAVAGEILKDETLLQYGKQRLQKVVDHVRYHTGFTEYNSPPYAKVVIAECERFLELAHDSETRSVLEFLRRTAWQVIAESFHPGTQQWAGPHSRTSRDRLRKSTTKFLSDRVGINVKTHWSMTAEQPRGYAVVSPRQCPEEFLPLFQKPNPETFQIKRTFIRRKNKVDSVIGTTWFSPAACLGSASQSIFWTQRKPIIGYWKTEKDTAVVFRVRFLHEGKDFASMAIRSDQQNEKILMLVHSVPDKGDWHTSQDRPASQIFQATNFRLLIELQGEGVSIEKVEKQKFALIAGDHKIIIHTLPGTFANRPVKWITGGTRNYVSLSAVCYQGQKRAFDFRKGIPIQLAAGIELIPTNRNPAATSPTQPEKNKPHYTWLLPNSKKLELAK